MSGWHDATRIGCHDDLHANVSWCKHTYGHIHDFSVFLMRLRGAVFITLVQSCTYGVLLR